MALLLPDASVLVGGGRFFFNNTDPTTQLNYEIYYPPYLFTSTGALAARPDITTAPTGIVSDTTPFTVQTSNPATSIASAVLIRAGSVTHSFNGGQRFVPLDIVSRVGTTLNVRLSPPADASLAPPGDYMLFVVDTSGVPSVARFVQVAP